MSFIHYLVYNMVTMWFAIRPTKVYIPLKIISFVHGLCGGFVFVFCTCARFNVFDGLYFQLLY